MPAGPSALIHGDLRFDRRHDVCYGVDDGAVEFEEGHGQLHGRRFRRIFNLFADFLGEANPRFALSGTSASVGSSPTTLGFCLASIASIRRSISPPC